MKHLFLVLLLVTGLAHANEDCLGKFPAGVPTSSIDTTLSCKKGQAIVHYDACKTPLVVVEYLTPERLGGPITRDGQRFRPDPAIAPQFQAVGSDYAHSGWDIGHCAPAEDMTTDAEEMHDSFHFSNAFPQAPKNNRGIWRIVEQRARALAVKQKGVYVFTGGIYSSDEVIGNGVCVPTHIYKIILDPRTHQSVAYLLPNTDAVVGSKLETFVTNMASIEKYTGIQFTPKKTVVDKIKIGFGLQK